MIQETVTVQKICLTIIQVLDDDHIFIMVMIIIQQVWRISTGDGLNKNDDQLIMMLIKNYSADLDVDNDYSDDHDVDNDDHYVDNDHHDVDNDYSDGHDYYQGVEVVGRLAAQGVDEEILKALVFIHGAAQVYIRYIRYISDD